MNLAQWWAEEARGEHYAPEGAQCSSGDELEVFHGLGFYLPLIALIYTDVSWNPWTSVRSVGEICFPLIALIYTDCKVTVGGVNISVFISH